MAEEKKERPSIFQKVLEAGEAVLDAQIAKARNSIEKKEYNEADFEWGKAVTKDRNYYIGSQGFQEKPGALTYEYMKQMAVKSSIVSAIIRTRQNRVSAYGEYVPEGSKKGFRIRLKYEKEELRKIRDELFGDDELDGIENKPRTITSAEAENINKAEPKPEQKPEESDADEGEELELPEEDMDALSQATEEEVPEEQLTEEDKDREARKELERRTAEKKKEIAAFILNCGETEDRPFDTRKWHFSAFLRAIVWDSLVYDQAAIERVPKEAEVVNGKFNIHHFYPVDGSTVRFASTELQKYKDSEMQLTQDFLYPEDELKALEQKDVLTLDPQRLERNEYKFVQLIRGRIQRAFTADEMRVGFRNPVADIYANGYPISELEMLVALITSHLQTEFYNRSYFQQGFSAKGILHIKANLNRAKLEELRRNWNHMVKGNRNSFQTPIMAGMDEVQWIPLTQSHSEMEFSLWLNYLIRMICAIYQVDPSEIGYGIKDEGSGGGLSGDNTKEKLKQSKDKGFVPLMKFMQDFVNKNIIDDIDDEYMLEWVGLDEETEAERIARQKEEVQYKKTVNEIRAEDGLPPIKGADHLLLNPVFFQWYAQFSEEAQNMAEQMQEQQAAMMDDQQGADQTAWEAEEAGKENDHARGIEGKMLDHQNKMEQQKLANQAKKGPVKKAAKIPAVRPLQKAVKIEYYRIS